MQKTVPVDYDKLTEQFAIRNIRMDTMSARMGYQKGFLYKTKQRGCIGTADALALKALTGITPEDYAPEPEPEPESEPVKLKEPEPIPSGNATVPPISGNADMVKAVKDLDSTVYALGMAVRELAGKLQTICQTCDRLNPLLDNGEELYKAIFMPIYNACKAATVENANNDFQRRRIDGTPQNRRV